MEEITFIHFPPVEMPAQSPPPHGQVMCRRCNDSGMVAQWDMGGGWSWAFCDCQIGKDECDAQHKAAGHEQK